MNLQQYWLGGMGLHEKVLTHIARVIVENKVKTIVEFGSGASTSFLMKLREELSLSYNVFSFDHHPVYSYGLQHEGLTLTRRDLQSCSNEVFERMFKNRLLEKDEFQSAQHEKDNFRAQNVFYDISSSDIPPEVDLVIVDGPNGNGRSIAYLHLIDKISDECIIVLDDSDHYDFIERCHEVFDTEVLVHESHPEIHHNFSYAILKVRRK